MPSPRARKTAMSETRWNRKLTMGCGNEPTRRLSPHPVMECQSSLEPQPEPVEERLQRFRGDRHHDHRGQRGADEKQHVAPPDATLVQAAHALGVDEHRPEPQPGEERRRHAPAALVEELDHRRVRADRDDERRAGFVREQHARRLRSCPARRSSGTASRSPSSSSRAGEKPSSRSCAISSAPQCNASSESESKSPMMMSRLEPSVEQRVGAAVDRDQHRLVLADVRPQRLEVVLVVVAAHDDQRVTAVDRRRRGPAARAARR